jgi:hypothetical protein
MLKDYSLDRFYNELENLCLACPVGCHIRDPRQSIRYQQAHASRTSHNPYPSAVDGNTQDDGVTVDSDGDAEDDDIQPNKRARYARTCKDPKRVYSSASITDENGSEVSDSDGD